MAAAVFDPAEFKEVYPHFANTADAVCRFAFAEAELYLNNTDASPVKDEEKRKLLLYMLTCHILTLKERGGDTVGQLSSASEGSVSVSYSVPSAPGAEWFSQTRCGLAFWQAIKPYTLGPRYYGRC